MLKTLFTTESNAASTGVQCPPSGVDILWKNVRFAPLSALKIAQRALRYGKCSDADAHIALRVDKALVAYVDTDVNNSFLACSGSLLSEEDKVTDLKI